MSKLSEGRRVPQIRFRGFEGDWVNEPLFTRFIKIIDFRGRTPKKLGMDWSKSGYLALSALNVKDGYIDNTAEAYFGDQQLYDAWMYGNDLYQHQVIFTTEAPMGNVAQVPDNKKYILSQRTIAFVTEPHELSDNYLAILLKSHNVTTQLLARSSGGTATGVSQKSLSSINVTLPNDITEQHSIGTYFKCLNNLIKFNNRKYEKFVSLKRAMLQKMFPQNGAAVPEVRFAGFEEDWKNETFGNCVLIQRGGSPRPIDKYITQDVTGINWVKIGDVKIGSRYITSTKEKIIPEGVNKSREVFKGDLILSNSMSFGRPYIMGIDGCIHDGWLLIRNDKNMFDLEFLLQILSSDYMLKQYRALAAGGVVNNLNCHLVQSTKINFPKYEEQQKIGAYFRNLDKLISLHATKLEKLRRIKSACLEKMFV